MADTKEPRKKYQTGSTKITVDLGPVLYPQLIELAEGLGISLASLLRLTLKELFKRGAEISLRPSQGAGGDIQDPSTCKTDVEI